jgi:prepilin-type N-terminal cleavage/methylation domain-containing protein/prepilin-type processing-associated H-X9-DG protein
MSRFLRASTTCQPLSTPRFIPRVERAGWLLMEEGLAAQVPNVSHSNHSHRKRFAMARCTRRYARSGFTLVELLVVIAIIGMLVALLLPAVQAAREAARRTNCANNFKQVGLAIQNFANSNGYTLPAGMVYWNHDYDSTAKLCGAFPQPQYRTDVGWAGAILPYMEQGAWFSQFNPTIEIDDYPNYKVIGNLIPMYTCPSDPQGGEWLTFTTGWTNGPEKGDNVYNTNMAGVANSTSCFCENGIDTKQYALMDGAMGNWQAARLADFIDGTSNTLMIGEVTGAGAGTKSGFWWVGWNVIDTSAGINGPYTIPGGGSPVGWYWRSAGFSSYHPGGCQFVFVDGSVHLLQKNIDSLVLKGLTTRAGADVAQLNGL